MAADVPTPAVAAASVNVTQVVAETVTPSLPAVPYVTQVVVETITPNIPSTPYITQIVVETITSTALPTGARTSAAPLITGGSGGANERLSAVPLITITSNVTSINNARVSAAPVIRLEQNPATGLRASAVPLLYIRRNVTAIATSFSIDCPSKNMIINGTGFAYPPAIPSISITVDGAPVSYTYLYGTSTMAVVHINNFVNGTYSVRVTG